MTATPVPIVNFRGARAVSPDPIITGAKPAYASSCPDVTAYWSACQCFEDIAATTVTITAPAQTVVITPTVTIESSSSTSSPSTTSSSLPTCTQGIEFALYSYAPSSSGCREISKQIKDVDFRTLVEGVIPYTVGNTSHMWFSQSDDSIPLGVYGIQGPPGSRLACSALMHRGYIKPTTTGNYTISMDFPDDIAHIWIGNEALSGSFWAGNSQVYGRSPDFVIWIDFVLSYSFEVTDISEYIPFRVFWSNRDGPGSLRVKITDATGTNIVGEDSQSNPSVVSSCDGTGSPAPAWPDWPSEVVGGPVPLA